MLLPRQNTERGNGVGCMWGSCLSLRVLYAARLCLRGAVREGVPVDGDTSPFEVPQVGHQTKEALVEPAKEMRPLWLGGGDSKRRRRRRSL